MSLQPLDPRLLAGAVAVAVASIAWWLVASSSAGLGNKGAGGLRTAFAAYIACGRARNRLCAPCDRWSRRYPVASTGQIPCVKRSEIWCSFFRDVGELYKFVFGYMETGTFVEIGAYDGESFSNTSGLADIGWTGHYVEPIPAYAAACAARHSGNPRVSVHTVCVGERDGEVVSLSPAGPFSSAVQDEIAAVSGSQMGSALKALGWSHEPAAAKVDATTTRLDTLFKKQGLAKPGSVDVMVVDTEGMEWQILKPFDIKKYRPKLVIVEIQELQNRYIDNERAQEDAANVFKYFKGAGYSILYKDVVNTVFIHSTCRCVGGD